MKQLTNKVLMIRPVNFYFNPETAVNNYYQKKGSEQEKDVEKEALEEFDNLVKKMKEKGINVKVISDTSEPYTPDSIFPNNWFISEKGGKLVLCPMFAENRRLERRKFLEELVEFIDREEIEILDYTSSESEGKFLEGTGAIVLDRASRKAYMCISPRGNKELFEKLCHDLKYKPVSFSAYQTVNGKRESIYHTNVMMAMGEKFAVVCLSSIDDLKERENLVSELKESGKEIIDISEEQTAHFAGNVIQLEGSEGKVYTVMSESAYNAFTQEQKKIILKSSEIIHSDASTIENYGGGSVRCTIAEVF